MRNQNRDWVEIIPERWKIGRISYKYHVQLGKMLQPEPKGIDDVKKPYLRSANLDWNGVKLDDVKEMWFSNQDLKKYKVEPGDILVSEGGDVGRSSFWDGKQELYIQNAINRLRPITEESNSKFLFYWFCFLKEHGLIDIMCDSSTIAHYTAEKVKATQLVYPSLSEQTQIANFLDHKTGQIDRLIEQKEKLLKLLAEKRTAIITKAVTKGLDPNVEMKDSGIDWLGAIPKHWEVKRFKFCLTEPLKYGANEAAESSDPDQPRFVRITDVDENGNLRDETFRSINIETAEPFLLQEGDILLARSGATVGKNFMYKSSWGVACFAGYLIRARINQEIMVPGFGNLFLSSDSYWNWVRSIFIQSTIQNISAEKYANLVLPVPPKEEQRKIVDFAARKRQQKSDVIDKIIRSIEKLKEYRKALITAAVTGQIDVRKEFVHE